MTNRIYEWKLSTTTNYECPKGHKTASTFRLCVDGEVINQACERCFGEWMEKTFPTKEVE